MTALNSYSVGTVSIAANGTTVTGVSTIWSGVNARPGDTLQIGNFQTIISDVTDSTHLVIPPWGGGAQSAVAYVIWQDSPLRFAGAQAMADVSTLIATLNTDGWYKFVPSTATDPTSYGLTANDGQYAFQASTGKLWIMSGGVWVFLGIYKGFNFRGAYNPATAYGVNDVLTSGGSAYIAIAPTTGNAPPNATFYNVLASAGASGANGTNGTNGATGPTPLTPVAPWVTATSYVIGPPASYVSQGGSSYQCLIPHTSGTFATDLAAGKWGLVAQAGTAGAGALLAANNLSDVASKIASIDNISVHGADIASAATLNLDTATGNFVHVTGTTAITAITLTDGRQRTVYFTGALVLTNGASLVLPGGANITTAAGDIAVFVADGSTVRCSDYLPASQANARALIGAATTPANWTRTVKTTGSGTYTTPAGCKAINVRLSGGGGGGGGTGSLNTSGAGGTGGTSTFGTSLLSANAAGGGAAGASGSAANGAAGGAGGAASGGDINLTGQGGGASSATPANVGGPGGAGGGPSGAPGTGSGSGAGIAGGAASGGAGAGGLAAGVGGGGGGGEGGYCEKLIVSPLATYSYAIGAGGGPGAAGTSGAAGGPGGAGLLIIDEYY